jgi:hypothetical protein
MSGKKMICIEGIRATIKEITEYYVILRIHGAVDFDEFTPTVKIMKRDDSFVWDILEKNGIEISSLDLV